MELEEISHEIFFSKVQSEPELHHDLGELLKVIRDKRASLVIDLSQVDIITISSLTRFNKLREHCSANGHHLILCNTRPTTKGIFVVTNCAFHEFESDKASAIKLVNLYLEDSKS